MQSEPHDKVGSFFDVNHITLVILPPYYQKLSNVLDLDFVSRNNAKDPTKYVINNHSVCLFVWLKTGIE